MVIRLTRLMTAIALVIGIIVPVATASAVDRGGAQRGDRHRTTDASVRPSLEPE